MRKLKNLSYAALEDCLNQVWDNAYFVTPTRIYVWPEHVKLALKVLRGVGWHHNHTARWRYLVRRGARK